MTATSTLLAGLGSPFGDDQLGWRIAGDLESQALANVTVVRIRSADQLLDRLAGVAHLIVCDACQGAGPVGSWHRWQWPSAQLAALRCGGTHDLGLAAVLALAERLGQLPPKVTVWGVEGKHAKFVCAPDDDVSEEVKAVIPEVAARIVEEVCHA